MSGLCSLKFAKATDRKYARRTCLLGLPGGLSIPKSLERPMNSCALGSSGMMAGPKMGFLFHVDRKRMKC